MSAPVLSVRQCRNGTTDEQIGRYCWVWCPGCRQLHAFIVSNADGSPAPRVQWDWDGNLNQPTFSPSLLCTDATFYGPADDNGDPGPLIGTGVCHSFVRAGRWEFLSDSGHHLAGQTVDMAPLPDWFTQEES